MQKYLIGADPELFLVDAEGNSRSAHNMIPGTKEEPHEVLGGAIQVDGVAAEFNINPAETAEAFTENIRDVLTELKSRIDSKGKGYSLIATPVMYFDKAYFKKLPAKAKLLGCEPDYNAYTGEVNPPPGTREPFRTGAGHIHIGWTEFQNPLDDAHMFDCISAVRQLDAVLYPLSLLWDDNDKRRELYGKVGAFRPKGYGVEYRPLSNAWVSDPDLHVWIFNATVHSMNQLDENDISIANSAFSKELLGEIHEGKIPSREVVKDYHSYLVREFAVPSMPAAYIA